MKNKKLCPITLNNYFFKKYKEKNVMKLNFLVYYTYCWYKVLTKKSLTFEKPVITQYGIFYNSLLQSIFKNNRDRNLKDPLPYVNFTPISEEISKLLDKIWDMYGGKDSIYLSALSQKDRVGLNEGDYIPNSIIHKNYILKE